MRLVSATIFTYQNLVATYLYSVRVAFLSLIVFSVDQIFLIHQWSHDKVRFLWYWCLVCLGVCNLEPIGDLKGVVDKTLGLSQFTTPMDYPDGPPEMDYL